METEKLTKYLFGRVHVETVVIETTENSKVAFIESKKIYDNPKIRTKENYQVYFLPWGEGGNLNTEQARQAVLTAFLELMNRVIPMTPSVEAPRIIIPTEFTPEGKPIFEKGTIKKIEG